MTSMAIPAVGKDCEYWDDWKCQIGKAIDSWCDPFNEPSLSCPVRVMQRIRGDEYEARDQPVKGGGGER